MNRLPSHRIFSIICLALIVATLPAMAQTSCTTPPLGLVDWWPGEGNAVDIVGTNNGTLVNGTGFAPGEVGWAFSFNGSLSNYVSIPDSPSLDVFTTKITIELWLKSNQSGANPDWRGIFSKGNSSWRLLGTTGSGTVTFGTTGLANLQLIGSRNVNDGQWHHVAAVYDGTNEYLYVDGALDVSTPNTGSISQTSDPVYIGNVANTGNSGKYYFNGLIDEVSIYNRALTASEIEAIYAAGSAGKCNMPPANFSLGFYPGLTISGAGYSYIIQSSTNLANTNGWLTLTNLILTQPMQIWVDTTVNASSPFNSQHFYRILPGQ
jgi:hypothetical protein